MAWYTTNSRGTAQNPVDHHTEEVNKDKAEDEDELFQFTVSQQEKVRSLELQRNIQTNLLFLAERLESESKKQKTAKWQFFVHMLNDLCYNYFGGKDARNRISRKLWDAVRRYRLKIERNVPGNAWTRILESANEAGLRIDPNSRIEGNVLFFLNKGNYRCHYRIKSEDVLKIQAAAAERGSTIRRMRIEVWILVK